MVLYLKLKEWYHLIIYTVLPNTDRCIPWIMKFRMQGEVNAQYWIFSKYLTYNQAPSVLGREVCVLPWAKDYTRCSVATGKVTQTGQASVEEPDKMYPIINGPEGLCRWVKPTPPRRGNSEIKSSPLGLGVGIRLPPWPYKNIYCWEASKKKI